MSSKKKVIIFLGELQHYRIPVLELVSREFDITVAVSNYQKFGNLSFKVIKSDSVKLGPFIFQKPNVLKIIKKYDIVICLFNIRNLDFLLMPYLTSKKVIYWGIGVSASYTKFFDEDKSLDFLRKIIINKSDAMIFYTDYPVKKYSNLDTKKFFVANNTIHVTPISNAGIDKDYILFVGSLYKEKGIDILLENYLEAYKVLGQRIKKLKVIGDGVMKGWVEDFVIKNNLQDFVVLLDGIYDQSILREHYSTSIISVSLKQAGLSILNSFGYSVPFVTWRRAVTGGEIFNINHEVTGLILENLDDIKEVFIDCSTNESKYLKMGQNAFDYYHNNRKIDNMANGIINSLKYVQ